MQIFRILVLVAWLAVMWVSIQAVSALGFDGANLFFSDFAQPWRAQFNSDFSAHLLLMAGWLFYRENNWLTGLLCAIAAILLGGAFSLLYIFVATFRAQGSFRTLLLGARA